MTITINIVRIDKNKPQDKLAEAELQFIGGELDGLKLLGFGIWQQRNGSGQNVTFPARHFTVNGERRNFTLLRAVDDRRAEDRVRQLVLQVRGFQTDIGSRTEGMAVAVATSSPVAVCTPARPCTS
jgi:hypothetical protein